MALATERSALIVAHGQPSDPYPAEEALKLVAAQLAIRLPGWTIASATMAAIGALEQALEQRPAAAIYPLFMADGWFTGTALPDRLLMDRRVILPPLGLDRNLPLLAAGNLIQRLNDLGWDARETRLVIAAHGGRHSPNPARAAHHFAVAVARLIQFAEIRVGFVGQSPGLALTASTLGTHALCLPFFATKGRHVRKDIPAALVAAGFEGKTLEPLGTDPQIGDLIAQSLRQSHYQKDAA